MELDLSELEPRHAHDILTSAIIPRPIAWVSTINNDNKINLAPFSFFTGVSYSPPMVAFSVMNRTDGTRKDTINNIEDIPEFVIHIVSAEFLQTMELTAKDIPCGSDEDLLKGIHLIPSKKVKPYRIKESMVAFECTLEKIVRVGEGACAGNLVLGRILLSHIDDELLIRGREIDYKKLNALGRLSGNRYCTIQTIIESQTN